MKTMHRLLSLCLLSSFLIFQSCASYPPRQPPRYPPPLPPKQQQPEQPSVIKPVRPDTTKPNAIAVKFRQQAKKQVTDGRLDLAAATLERGLRLAPKDAVLWSNLAEIKLQQKSYSQASSLAAKSNSLAGSNSRVIQKNQWIIEEARNRATQQ